MDEQRFRTLAAQARELTGGYGDGYRRGLRRRHRGERFRNAAENAGRMRVCQDDDESRADFARGLLDGLAGRDPTVVAI